MAPKFTPIGERFLERIDKESETPCWLWTGKPLKNGYGFIGIGGRGGGNLYIHRFAYEFFIGPIPDGYDIGHTCHDEAAWLGLCAGGWTCKHRLCVNPSHLKAQTRQD